MIVNDDMMKMPSPQVIALATPPSMPQCPPPPQCIPTDEILVAPLEPGIADARLAYLERVPANIHQPRLLHRGTLERSDGDRTPTVWYGLTLNIMPLRLRSAIRI